MVGKLDDTMTLATQKQKDAEPMDDVNLTMLTVPASISETSVVLKRTDEAPKKSRKKAWYPTGAIKRALQIFDNMCVDRGTTKIPYADWTAKMTSDMPDCKPQTRGSARDALIDNEWIISVERVCWKNKDLGSV